MWNRNLKLAAVLVVAVLASGCQMNKQMGGGLLGGALGGWAGSNIGSGRGQLAATAGGAILGMLVGSSIGQSLDRIDQMYARRASMTAIDRAPVGRTVSWQNPNTGHYGSTTPTRTYQTYSGQYCREYQQEVTVGGRTQRAYGTACRQPDGSWKISNS